MIRTLLGSLGLTLTVSATSFANTSIPNSDEWKAFVKDTSEMFVVPAHQVFAQTARALEQSNKQFCQQTSEANFTQLHSAYKQAWLSWQTIQGIRFGPIETFMRHSAMQFWPDKKNHVGKALNKLVTRQDAKTLSLEGMLAQPVSLRGFPALERLLYEDNARDVLGAEPFRCQTAYAISNMIAHTAESLYSEWQNDMLPEFQNPDHVDGYFEDEVDAATYLLKPLVEHIEWIKDMKLKRPSGSSLEKARYTRLESWRSKLAKASLQQNLSALELFYRLGDQEELQSIRKLLLAHRPAASVANIDSLFTTTQNLIDALPEPLSVHFKQDSGYQEVQTIADTLSRLHDALEDEINALGIHLGFNSLDGD